MIRLLVSAFALTLLAGPAPAQSCQGVLEIGAVTQRLLSKSRQAENEVEYSVRIRNLTSSQVTFRLTRAPVAGLSSEPYSFPTRIAGSATQAVAVGRSAAGVQVSTIAIRSALQISCGG